jgi:hypothetical protein
MAAAFFLDRPAGTWTKIGIAIAGLVLGWLCYSIASNILTYMHTAPEEGIAPATVELGKEALPTLSR